MDKYILDGQYGKYLELAGVRVSEALKAAGVPEDLFSRKKPVLGEADFYRFMEAAGSQIASPELPVMLASADNIESFSPPIFAAYCSRNGRACLERLAQYKRIIAPMRYEVTQKDGQTMLLMGAGSPELSLPQFLVETEMVFILHIMRRATKQHILPVRIEMQEPVYAEAFLDFVGCEVADGGENIIIFADEDMERPFISHNENMWEFFEPELQKRLSEMEQDDSFAARVRSELTELLPGSAGTADDVAAKLGISKRTLQRKLLEENTSFQKQLNGTREFLARHYIRNTDMSSEEIAFMLGYQEVNSFLRAFNIWTGMSITAYREKN